MTKTVSIEAINDSIHAAIALTENGDEIVLEENGEPVAKVIRLAKSGNKPRTAGLGKGYWMAEDFDAELPDDFWGFDEKP